MLSGWVSGGEEITRANSAWLFVLLSPNETDSPETPKLAVIPHSLSIFQLVPSLLHQNLLSKTKQVPRDNIICWSKAHASLYSGTLKNTQSSVTEQSPSKVCQQWGISLESLLVCVLHGLKCSRRERHSGFDDRMSKWLLGVHGAELHRLQTLSGFH